MSRRHLVPRHVLGYLGRVDVRLPDIFLMSSAEHDIVQLLAHQNKFIRTHCYQLWYNVLRNASKLMRLLDRASLTSDRIVGVCTPRYHRAILFIQRFFQWISDVESRP